MNRKDRHGRALYTYLDICLQRVAIYLLSAACVHTAAPCSLPPESSQPTLPAAYALPTPKPHYHRMPSSIRPPHYTNIPKILSETRCARCLQQRHTPTLHRYVQSCRSARLPVHPRHVTSAYTAKPRRLLSSRCRKWRCASPRPQPHARRDACLSSRIRSGSIQIRKGCTRVSGAPASWYTPVAVGVWGIHFSSTLYNAEMRQDGTR